jgi:sterol desaturase/sphingolipid hydroxylase (fatty acid hydroxylase superfamily)
MTFNWLQWIPLFIVMVGEHFALTRIWNLESSVQRLFRRRSDSGKTDLVFVVLYTMVFPIVGIAVHLLAVPGIILLLIQQLAKSFQFTGLFGGFMPDNSLVLIVTWLLLIDFSVYLTHVLMHKYLWSYHKVHHAATEMNLITGVRVSIAESFFNDVGIYILVSLLLGLPSPEGIFWVLFVRRFIDIVQHSDLPISYGPLDYIIASPRFHRLHHSSLVEDHDTNYSNIFAFWDYAFGTVSKRYRVKCSVADTCPLGLGKAEENHVWNNWFAAIFAHTFVHHAFAIAVWVSVRWRKLAAARSGRT